MYPKSFHPTHNYEAPEKIKKSKKGKWFARLFFLILFAGVFVFLFRYILPQAEVVIYFSSTDFEKDYGITLDKNLKDINYLELYLPASVYEETGAEQKRFNTTGKKDIGDKASGFATFFNFTGRPQPLTAAVELNYQSGKIYLLKSDITIPSATVSDIGEIIPGKIQGEIQAKEAGDLYNEQAGRISISILTPEIQEKIYANCVGTSGGNSKIISVISEEDLNNAENELSQILTPKLKSKIKNNLKNKQETIRDELISFEILNSEKSVEIDKEAKDFEMKITAILKAITFNEDELKKLLKSRSLIDLPSDRMVAEDDLGDLKISVDQVDFSLGVAKLKIQAIYKIIPKTDIDSIKDKIKGRSEIEARKIILSMENIRDVHFNFSFNIWNKIPNNLNKIKIKVGK
jgi:hypothetical protein